MPIDNQPNSNIPAGTADQTSPFIVTETADAPPSPFITAKVEEITPQPKPLNDASPIPTLDIPPVVSIPPQKSTGGVKKFGSKKIVATILGVLLLVGGIGAGIILVKQQQDIRNKAAGEPCSTSTDDSDCQGKLVGDSCPDPIDQNKICRTITRNNVMIKGDDGKPFCYCRHPNEITEPTPTPTAPPGACNGCLSTGVCVTGNTNSECGTGGVACVACTEGQVCQNGSCVTTGTSPLTQCTSIEAYTITGDPSTASATWTKLSSTQLASLIANDVIYFLAKGNDVSGVSNVDKVQIVVNSQTIDATKKDTGLTCPQTVGSPCNFEYYAKYTVPSATTTFAVSAKLHDSLSDTWF